MGSELENTEFRVRRIRVKVRVRVMSFRQENTD
jgi:hypothetical protein